MTENFFRIPSVFFSLAILLLLKFKLLAIVLQRKKNDTAPPSHRGENWFIFYARAPCWHCLLSEQLRRSLIISLGKVSIHHFPLRFCETKRRPRVFIKDINISYEIEVKQFTRRYKDLFFSLGNFKTIFLHSTWIFDNVEIINLILLYPRTVRQFRSFQ